MMSLAHASLARCWMREDCTDHHLSIGCGQLSRLYVVPGQGDNAERYGGLCLPVGGKEPPLYLAYAHVALDADEKKNLEDNLASLDWP